MRRAVSRIGMAGEIGLYCYCELLLKIIGATAILPVALPESRA
jgi:hypothetical protein